MNKKLLVKKRRATLVEELELYIKAARAAHSEATHEQSKAENKYDTRGLEASYLARGQSKQAAEIEKSLDQLEKLALRKFFDQDPIDLSALVAVKSKSEVAYYFVAPCAGGTEVRHEKLDICIITPQSPLGQQLIGKRVGDKIQLHMGSVKESYLIATVE